MRNRRVTRTAEAIIMFETAVCAPALQLTADLEKDPASLFYKREFKFLEFVFERNDEIQMGSKMRGE